MTSINATRPGRSSLALPVIAAAQLLMVMDGTIVTVGLPVIGTGLGIAETDLDWVLTAYALAFGGLLLAGGRAGDLFGRRRPFRAGLAVFLAASLLGGLAGNGTVLIAARVLQGVGAAIVAPAALSLLADTFPAGPQRNRALGVYGAMGGLGSVVGLLLGGALTEYLGWRWIMFVNIPIALLVLAGTFALVPGTRERGGIDLPGAATVTLALGSLVYAINRAGSHGAGDALTLTFGAVAVALLAAFVLIQRGARNPMLPAGVPADRRGLGANLVMLLMGAGQLATFYFLTIYMQTIERYSPMITGLAYLPFAIGIGIGIGFGFGFVAATLGGVQGIAPQDSGIASGLVNTSQQIGGALGLAVLAGVAVTTTANQPPGTGMREALTSGYTAGMLGAGVFYLAAILTAVLLLRPGAAKQPTRRRPPCGAGGCSPRSARSCRSRTCFEFEAVLASFNVGASNPKHIDSIEERSPP
ncbi:MFS transporter [Nonomuraea sp. NPDC050643]|uniref:MFS transporter n=1 Tax=Nonomuraea sp. NPDC050643 TaxID=3155660 RepID=UPI0033E40639